jgi:hypothetical protein
VAAGCDCEGKDADCWVCGGTGVVLRKTPRRPSVARCLAPHPDPSARVGRCYLPQGHAGHHSAPAAGGGGMHEVTWD